MLADRSPAVGPPPSLAPTIIITMLFGWFGLIPTTMAAKRAKADGHSAGRYWTAFWAIMATISVVAVGSALAVFSLNRPQEVTTATPASKWTDPAIPPAAPSPLTPTLNPESVPPPASFPATTLPPAQAPTLVRVAFTCGASGKGDCFLTERSAPAASSRAIRRWPEGSALAVTCQIHGESVAASALGGQTSAVWSRTVDGGYVANIFLDGVHRTSVTTPC